jgi:hypothetical protein
VADEIRLEITGRDKNLREVIKSDEKLVKRFAKTAKNASKRREAAEKKTSKDIRRAQIAEVKRTIAQDERLFKKRARNRLKKYKQELANKKQLEREKIAETRKANMMDRRLSRRRARNRLRQMKSRQREEIRREKRHVARMRRIRGGIFRGVGRLGAVGGIGGLLGGIGLVFKAREILDFDVKLASLADQAGITRKKQMELREELTDTAIATGVQRDVILNSFRRIVDKSGEFDVAAENVERLAKVIRGTQVDPIALGETVAAIAFSFKGQEKPVFDFLNMIVAQGDKASITLQDMAANGEELMGAFKRGGFSSVKDFAEFFALTQVAGGGGTSPEAATMMKNLVQQIKKRASMDKPFGGIPGGRALAEKLIGPGGFKLGFADVVKEMLEFTGGDITKISKLLPNIRGSAPLELLIAEFRRTGGTGVFDMLTKVALESGDVIERKYRRVAETASQGFERLFAVITKLSDVMLLPTLNQLSDSIIELVENEDKMDNLVQTFRDFGEVLKLIAKTSATVANNINRILEFRRKNVERQKTIKNLSPKERSQLLKGGGFFESPETIMERNLEEIEKQRRGQRIKFTTRSLAPGTGREHKSENMFSGMRLFISNIFNRDGREQETTIELANDPTRTATGLSM